MVDFETRIQKNNFRRDNCRSIGTIRSIPDKSPARPKVTIAIGLIIKGTQQRQGTIIFASDSQTTYPGGQKRLDAKKIGFINFKDAQVLVAQAGSCDLADQAIEIMRQKAKSVSVENDETIARIAQESIREIRNHLTELNKNCNFSAQDWMRFWREDHNFELMLGFYINGEPLIYTLDLELCFPVKLAKPFKSIGCGKFIADFLLTEYQAADPEFEYGYPATISIIQSTIDNVDGCNRPVWIGVCVRTPSDVLAEYEKQKQIYKTQNREPRRLYFNCKTVLFAQEEIGWVIDELKLNEPKFKSQQKEMMLGVLKNSWKRRNEWAHKINTQIDETEQEMTRRGLEIPPEEP